MRRRGGGTSEEYSVSRSPTGSLKKFLFELNTDKQLKQAKQNQTRMPRLLSNGYNPWDRSQNLSPLAWSSSSRILDPFKCPSQSTWSPCICSQAASRKIAIKWSETSKEADVRHLESQECQNEGVWEDSVLSERAEADPRMVQEKARGLEFIGNTSLEKEAVKCRPRYGSKGGVRIKRLGRRPS